jgi:hypothetical protein
MHSFKKLPAGLRRILTPLVEINTPAGQAFAQFPERPQAGRHRRIHPSQGGLRKIRFLSRDHPGCRGRNTQNLFQEQDRFTIQRAAVSRCPLFQPGMKLRWNPFYQQTGHSTIPIPFWYPLVKKIALQNWIGYGSFHLPSSLFPCRLAEGPV